MTRATLLVALYFLVFSRGYQALVATYPQSLWISV